MDPATDCALLKTDNLVRTYRIGGNSIRAIDGVSLELRGGEFVAIAGPSGAGKSTLMHLLGALDSPDSGSIRFRGEEIGELDDREQSTFRRHQVGFVFQFFNLLPAMSAWENVVVPKLLDGRSPRSAKREALRLLELVGLGNRSDHRPAELSGGQMQRVAIARALIMDPPMILADEPTGNLDSATGAKILRLLSDIAHEPDASRLVVIVTHDRSAAAAVDRTLTLTDGRLVAERPWGPS